MNLFVAMLPNNYVYKLLISLISNFSNIPTDKNKKTNFCYM